VLVLASRILLALVFALAGAAKLTRRRETEATLDAFGVPPGARPALAIALPLGELAIAAALLVVPTAAAAGVVALLLLVAFSFAVGRVLARGEEVDCNCFGSLGPSRISRRTLTRNLALLVPAAIVATLGWSDPGPSPVAWIGGIDAAAIGEIVAGVALFAALAGFALSWQLMRQNGRLLARLDALETGGRRDDAVLAGIGEPMPAFELPDLIGRPVSLAELLEEGRGVLLIFTDPDCHACGPLLPEIGRLQRDPAADPRPVVISRGDAAANEAKVAENGLRQVLLQEGFDLPRSVGVEGMPGAIELDHEGWIVGAPALGTDAVGALLREVERSDGADPILEVVKIGGGSW
jgi:Methylamine utilisation protein MauE/AhpC/TSA family